jgi:hypothetical protein
MEHFPHRVRSEQTGPISTEEIISSINQALQDLNPGSTTDDGANNLQELVERSRESLDEVKAQTEYQDQKSTRLLTVSTLFVALSGLLMNAFAQHHSVRIVWGGTIDWRQVLAATVYLCFALFVLSVIAGALVTFHATQTRFRYEKGTAIKPNVPPESQIFFRGIIRAGPTEWAGSFTEGADSGTVPARDLSLRYAKNYILESYLVAAKVADKMRYLEAAQAILASSMKILLFWLVLLALVSLFLAGGPIEDRSVKLEVAKNPSTVLTFYSLSAAPAPAPEKRYSEIADARTALERSRDN